MDIDTIRDQWPQIRGLAKEWWSSFTEDDLDGIDGNIARLIGKIEERYGFSKDRATQDVYARLKNMERQSLKIQWAQDADNQLKNPENDYVRRRFV